MYTGMGIVRAMPGPVFSIATFAGGMALQELGDTPEQRTLMQLLGCLIGTVAIFLPSALLVLFFFPVWQYLKKYVFIYRALEGINAAVVGIMFAAGIYLLTENFKDFSHLGNSGKPQVAKRRIRRSRRASPDIGSRSNLYQTFYHKRSGEIPDRIYRFPAVEYITIPPDSALRVQI